MEAIPVVVHAHLDQQSIFRLAEDNPYMDEMLLGFRDCVWSARLLQLEVL